MEWTAGLLHILTPYLRPIYKQNKGTFSSEKTSLRYYRYILLIFIMRFAAHAKDRVVPVGGGWILAFAGCIFYKIL